MKNCLSLILALVLMLTVLPMGALAAENTSERDEILEKACVAFPEYAAKIAADTLPASALRSAEPQKMVFTETRAISENEFIVYTEYSDGLVVLDQGVMDKEVIYNSTNDVATAINVDITVKATCTDTSAYFKVSNIKFTINTNSYDRINSIGSPKVYNPSNTFNDECIYVQGNHSLNSQESASRKAYVCYPLSFKFAPYPGYVYTSELWVEVGQNALSVHHDKW